MTRNAEVKIQIEGNTCDIGTAEYNLALGERRASSAKMYLERLGINPQSYFHHQLRGRETHGSQPRRVEPVQEPS